MVISISFLKYGSLLDYSIEKIKEYLQISGVMKNTLSKKEVLIDLDSRRCCAKISFERFQSMYFIYTRAQQHTELRGVSSMKILFCHPPDNQLFSFTTISTRIFIKIPYYLQYLIDILIIFILLGHKVSLVRIKCGFSISLVQAKIIEILLFSTLLFSLGDEVIS